MGWKRRTFFAERVNNTKDYLSCISLYVVNEANLLCGSLLTSTVSVASVKNLVLPKKEWSITSTVIIERKP